MNLKDAVAAHLASGGAASINELARPEGTPQKGQAPPAEHATNPKPQEGRMGSESTIRIDYEIPRGAIAGYRGASLVGERLFPRVTVTASGGKALVFDRGDFAQHDTLRDPGSAVRRIGIAQEGSEYCLWCHSLAATVPIELARDIKEVANIGLEARAANLVMHGLLRSLEIEQAALATDPGSYAEGHAVAPAAAQKWANEKSDPEAQIGEGKQAIRKAIGIEPNILVVSGIAFRALARHPALRAFGAVTPALLADVFDVQAVAVAKHAHLVGDGDFTDTWGNCAILAYVPNDPAGAEEPSFGYTYTMDGHPMMEQLYFDKRTQSYVVMATMERAPAVTGQAAGYLIQNPA